MKLAKPSAALAWCLLWLALFLALAPSLLAQDGEAAAPAAEVLLPFYSKEPGRWGYRTRAGDVVIPPRFETRGYFHEGIAIVEFQRRHCLIDPTGNVVARIRANEVRPFANGLAAARQGRRWGYLDRNGEWAVKPLLVECTSFQQDRAFAESGRALDKEHPWGIIDTHGNWITSPSFAKVKDGFHEGLASVCLPGEPPEWVIIDLQGERVSDRTFTNPPGPFDSGLALVELGEGEFVTITREAEDASIDTSEFAWLRDFHDGLAAARVEGDIRPLWGFIDTSGQWAIPPQFLEVSDFAEGLAAVRVGPDWSVVDKEGRVVIPAEYAEISAFGEQLAGYAEARRSDGVVGYLSHEGVLVPDGWDALRGPDNVRGDVHFGLTKDELLKVLKGREIEERVIEPGKWTYAITYPHNVLPKARAKQDVLEIYAKVGDWVHNYWLVEDKNGTWRVFSSLTNHEDVRF